MTATQPHKTPLLGMTLTQLQDVVRSLGMPAFTAKQLAQWLYAKRVGSIDQMTNISLRHRHLLSQEYEVGAHPPVDEMRSVDGTVKYLYGVPGPGNLVTPGNSTNPGNSGSPSSPSRSGSPAHSNYVESVFIPDDDRATLCVSSQVGCKMNCRFCMTGRQGFTAHLTAGDILNQIHSLPERDRLTNIVLMGMGEPLDNLDAVLQALNIITAPWGYAWSPRRITVSTVGVKRGLKRFLDESDCHLAISLHTPIPQQRRELMPAEQAYSITEVVDLLRNYDFSGQRRLSFEYILFRGVNDSLLYAKELLRLLRGLNCRINLIRFHAIPNVDLQGADTETMLAFRNYLTAHGLFATIRASRGEDIFAACGMLSTARQEA